ncbi:MAG: transcriptional regulator [Armatimonadetes bacterium]|nr:transcriptional regulator [Armatimonadota bacterium]
MTRPITAARREIVTLLRREGPLTVDMLGEKLGITPVGVRKHLDVLQIDGLVATTTQRRKIGRPVQLYSLTEEADELFPKFYDATLASVLRQVRRIGGNALVRQVLEGRQQEQEEAFRQRAGDAATLEERVALLAQVRDEAGYMAEWSQEEGGAYVLKEHNCALCRVAREFHEFCDSELALFRRALGEGVSVERIGHTAGAGGCTYLIRAEA